VIARQCFGTSPIAQLGAPVRVTMSFVTPPSKHREISPPPAPLGKIGTGKILVDKLKIFGMNGDTLLDHRFI
jgi:hypothetical protein